MKKPVKPLEELLESVRDIDGFPIGTDEDILALSDPPYYTACPNPYINDFIEEYGTPYDEETDDYHREPFAGDVSEGKKNKIYNIHSYHTKVPHKAIIRFLNHYTNEGDVVLDAFAGTGMTAIAAKISRRNAIVSDISPIASFISHNINNLNLLKDRFENVIKEVETSCEWMYETKNEHGETCQIDFVVWAECFKCPYCESEFDFYNSAIDHETGRVSKEFKCNSCSALITKAESDRATNEYYDSFMGANVVTTKSKPVLISYFDNGEKKQKRPDKDDLIILQRIEDTEIPYWFPVDKMMGIGSRWGIHGELDITLE